MGDRRNLIDHFARLIEVVGRDRDRLDPEKWDAYECSALTDHVNLEREERGRLRVNVPTVRRVQQAAWGHSDYVMTFAIGCADLVVAEGEPMSPEGLLELLATQGQVLQYDEASVHEDDRVPQRVAGSTDD